MDNSTFFSMASPVIDATNMEKYEKHWANGCNWRRFDQISSNAQRITSLIDEMIETKNLSSDLLLDPSLEEFSLLLCEPLRVENTFICFRKTIMKSDDFIPPFSGENVIEYSPAVDAYVYLNNAGSRCNMVVNIGRMLMTNGKNTMRSTYSLPVWRDDDPESLVNQATTEYLYEFSRSVKLMYMAIQYALLNRPTRFVLSGPARPVVPAVSNDRHHNKKNKCKAVEVRYLRLIDEPVPVRDENAEKRSMNCPCWGVMGHVRHYKSGKTIWIKPYRKGKERKKPDSYQPKEYEIPERRSQNEFADT